MNSKTKILIGISVISVLLISGYWIWRNQNETVQIVQPTETFNLYSPIEIKDTLYYKDGGTTGIIIKDNSGKTSLLCLDGRMQIDEPGRTPKPYHVYIGATYPTDPKAQKIPIGGKEEKAILKILQNCIVRKMSEEEQTRLSNIGTVVGLSEEELKIYRVLRVIKRLKNR